MGTVAWQRVEGAVVFVAALILYLFMDVGVVWWLAVILFFAPDVSFAGYVFGPKVGAVAYNLVHVYAFGAALLAAGAITGLVVVSALGALWLAHSGFDRMFGYGLKSPEGFKVTHLGAIGGTSERQ